MQKSFEILFENDRFLVVAKASGVCVIPDRFGLYPGASVRELLEQKRGEKIYVVHRIDKDTSGLVVFSKTADEHRHLSTQFEQRKVVKEYLGLVEGIPENRNITLPIAPLRKKPGRVCIDFRDGKESHTTIEVLEKFHGSSWVKFIPLTGRSHQIRIHMASIHHPLFIDPIYGTDRKIYLSRMKPGYRPKGDEEKPLLERLPLHASFLRFSDSSDTEREYSAPLPKDLKATLTQLRKLQS